MLILYTENMEPQSVNTLMRCCWNITPVSLDTIVKWSWENACSDLWSRYRFWKSHFRIGENERTIEIGCGYGKFSLALGLSGAQVALLDYNASALSTAVEVHGRIGLEPEAIQGDLFDLPEDLLGTFDLVCSFGTLEHFAGDQRRQAFAACSALLRPGGLLFFTVSESTRNFLPNCFRNSQETSDGATRFLRAALQPGGIAQTRESL